MSYDKKSILLRTTIETHTRNFKVPVNDIINKFYTEAKSGVLKSVCVGINRCVVNHTSEGLMLSNRLGKIHMSPVKTFCRKIIIYLITWCN